MPGWMRSLASLTVCFTLCWSWAPPSWAGSSSTRSAAQRLSFQRDNPCPATGQRRGSCPGYVIDHVQPLCAGGADHPSNMQWQTTTDARAKDVGEWRTCRSLRQQPR